MFIMELSGIVELQKIQVFKPNYILCCVVEHLVCVLIVNGCYGLLPLVCGLKWTEFMFCRVCNFVTWTDVVFFFPVGMCC